jgi:hypothetical protein
LAWAVPAAGAEPADAGAADFFFEKKIRPVLVERCYSCHSAQAAKPNPHSCMGFRRSLAGIQSPRHRKARQDLMYWRAPLSRKDYFAGNLASSGVGLERDEITWRARRTICPSSAVT